MVVYFDCDNILSFIRSSKDKRRYEDCMRMLEDYFDIRFTFSKESLKSLDDDGRDDIKQWLSDQYAGNNEIKWDFGFPIRPFETNQIVSQSKTNKLRLCSVYCLKDNNGDIKNAIAEGSLLVADVGDELNILSSLLMDGNQYTKNVISEIKEWKDLEPYTAPCTDIIICDKFILSSEDIYRYNIYAILQVLSAKNKGNLNIVIFTLRENYDKRNRRKYSPNFEKIYQEIKSKLKNKKNLNITFIVSGEDKLKEHDRTIFTNYNTYSSGDTYNYFDSKGKKISTSRYLDVYSHAYKVNIDNSNKFIDDMQTLINELLENKGLYIKNDEVSNYFKFSL